MNRGSPLKSFHGRAPGTRQPKPIDMSIQRPFGLVRLPHPLRRGLKDSSSCPSPDGRIPKSSVSIAMQPTLPALREDACLAGLLLLEAAREHQTIAPSALRWADLAAGRAAALAETSVFHVKHIEPLYGKVADLRPELPKYSLIQPPRIATLAGHLDPLWLS